MGNPAKISVISQIGTCVGQISCDVIAHDDDNNEYDEVPSDPFDLVGQSLNFTVYIKDASDMPENFCNGIYVEYTSFTDNITYKTKAIEERTRNPTFEEMFEHRIEYLTKEDIEYMMNEKVKIKINIKITYFFIYYFQLCFKVFAYEEVEKKGKTQRESITNNSGYNSTKASVASSSPSKNPFHVGKIYIFLY